MATPWRFESSPGHQRLFRRKPKKFEKPRKINVLRGFLLPAVSVRSNGIDDFYVYMESRCQARPKRGEPKSEVVFRVAKSRERPYLLTDGNELALRVWPDGSKTWLLRYRRPSTGKENFLGLGPYPISRSLMRDGRPLPHAILYAKASIRSNIAGPRRLPANAWPKAPSISWPRAGSTSNPRNGRTKPTGRRSLLFANT